MKLLSATMVAAALLLAGCATPPTPLGPNEARLTIHSNPPGATIYVDGQQMVAPTSLIFTLSTGQDAFQTNAITARWNNGASEATRLNLRRGEWNYVFQGSANAARMEQGTQSAGQRSNAAASQDVGDALYEAGRALGAAAVRQRAAPPPAPAAPQTINCSSYARPSGIETRCR